jgi:hypothetical protein
MPLAGRPAGAGRTQAMQLLTPADAAGRVTAALKTAAQATGAGFDYLLRTAKRESSLDPTAQAPTSSARGLFQFIDQTWLEVLKEEGPKLGLGDAAAAVSRSTSGKYTVADPVRRAELLAMRDDPQAAAMLAGAFTRRNATAFEASLGRAPSEGELYAAHFLGARGAVELTSLAATSPTASAAAAFPAQASANRAIFYDKGRPRSAIEVYGRLTATSSPGEAPSPVRMAAAPSAPGPQDERPYNGGVENDRAAFHSMFKTGRRSPVSAYVQQAWSAFGDAGMAADISKSPGKAAIAAPAYAPAATPAPAVVAVEAAARKPAARKHSAAAEPPAARGPATPQTAPAASASPRSAEPAAARAPLELGSFLKAGVEAPTPAKPIEPRRGGRP